MESLDRRLWPGFHQHLSPAAPAVPGRDRPRAPYIDDFADWLQERGYPASSRGFMLRSLAAWTDWLAEKSRTTKSGATRPARWSRAVVFAERLRLAPAIPASRISRPTRSPSAGSSARIRGRPYTSRLAPQISLVRSVHCASHVFEVYSPAQESVTRACGAAPRSDPPAGRRRIATLVPHSAAPFRARSLTPRRCRSASRVRGGPR